MPVSTRAGGSVRARDLAMGMLLACTSLVANAVVSGDVSGDGSVGPGTAAALPEPFTMQGAAGPDRGGTVVTATALASTVRPLTDSGPAVPGTATGQPADGSLARDADGPVAPSEAVSAEPVENPVVTSPEAPSVVEPAQEAGDELEGPVTPVLEPVTELLAPTGITEATEPALSMLSSSFA